jgi:hypothetical protein
LFSWRGKHGPATGYGTKSLSRERFIETSDLFGAFRFQWRRFFSSRKTPFQSKSMFPDGKGKIKLGAGAQSCDSHFRTTASP